MSITMALSIAILRFVITIFATALACILSRSQYKLKLKNNHFLTDTPIDSLKPVQLQRFHQDYALKWVFQTIQEFNSTLVEYLNWLLDKTFLLVNSHAFTWSLHR